MLCLPLSFLGLSGCAMMESPRPTMGHVLMLPGCKIQAQGFTTAPVRGAWKTTRPTNEWEIHVREWYESPGEHCKFDKLHFGPFSCRSCACFIWRLTWQFCERRSWTRLTQRFPSSDCHDNEILELGKLRNLLDECGCWINKSHSHRPL